MVNVAIYVRLSDEDRNKANKIDESESIQNQKSMLRDYCKERDWDIFDIYCDENYSGIDKTRPEFNRMLKDCENGKINIVLCKSQSRFSRDMEVIEKYIHDRFLEWNVRFVGVVDHADTNDISNKKTRQINGLINEWYLEEVSQNIRKTLNHKRKQGEFIGSFAPYGYLIDPDNKNHLIVDENTAPIVRNIFKWYAQGNGYRKIVLELNNLGIPNPTMYKQQLNSNYVNKNENNSPSKGLWTHPTIYTIIRNETYTGTLVQGKTHSVSYKNKKRKPVDEKDWIRVPNCHEAVIDTETWNMVQERLKSKARVCKTTYELSPLSGKVKCAVCGRPMKRDIYYNKNRTKTYYALQCATYKTGAMNCTNISSISGLKLEPIIVEQINNLIQQYCQMDKIEIENKQNDTLQTYTKTLKSFQEQIDINQKRIEKLYVDKLDDLITKEQFIQFSEKYNNEISDLKAKCESVEFQIRKIKNKQQELLNKHELLSQYSHIEILTRPIVEEFIDTVYIGEKNACGEREIAINWNF